MEQIEMLNKKNEVVEKLNSIDEQLKKIEGYGLSGNNQVFTMAKSMKELLAINTELMKNIDTLTKMVQGNLAEADACEFFMIKNYRAKPVIFKDGKLVSYENMKEATVYYKENMPIEVRVGAK